MIKFEGREYILFYKIFIKNLFLSVPIWSSFSDTGYCPKILKISVLNILGPHYAHSAKINRTQLSEWLKTY